jgi:hypothetical protein
MGVIRAQAGCATVSALSSARRFKSVPPQLSQTPALVKGFLKLS